MMKFSNLIQLADKYELIMGSASPRRILLLEEAGVKFTQMIPAIDEINHAQLAPEDYAVWLAEQKAISFENDFKANQLIIGCDTIVVLEDLILEKPVDKDDALKILSALSGREHRVITALAIRRDDKIIKSGYETTKVFFNQVTSEAISDYIETGEPMDKAGAYGIQGMGAFLVDRIEGNLDNVIGLPRTLLDKFSGEIINSI